MGSKKERYFPNELYRWAIEHLGGAGWRNLTKFTEDEQVKQAYPTIDYWTLARRLSGESTKPRLSGPTFPDDMEAVLVFCIRGKEELGSIGLAREIDEYVQLVGNHCKEYKSPLSDSEIEAIQRQLKAKGIEELEKKVKAIRPSPSQGPLAMHREGEPTISKDAWRQRERKVAEEAGNGGEIVSKAFRRWIR
jgi:hypothetical protein